MKLSEATYFPDAKELTRHGFVFHMLDFIGKLIDVNNSLSADVDDYLKGFDIDAPKAIEMLTEPEIEGFPESAVVIRSERIKNGGTDEFGKPMKDEFLVIYKVPKRDPEKGIKGVDEKLRDLYIRKYENHIVEGTILNEEDGGDGATNASSSGQYTTPLFGMVRRKLYSPKGERKSKKKKKKKGKRRPIGKLTMFITEEQMRQLERLIREEEGFGGGALTTSNVGVDGPNDWQYDVPFGAESKDDPAMDHSNLFDRDDESNKPAGHDGRSVKESKSVKRLNESSWGISDKDLRNIERIDKEDWEYFNLYAYCGLENGTNEPVRIAGYVCDPHEILGRTGRGTIMCTRSSSDVYIKDVKIFSDWETLPYELRRDTPTPTKWPKIKVGKMWGDRRLEIEGLTEQGKEIFCRFQWEKDEFPISESKSGIHIKEKNKGKFTATKKRTGKSTEELTHSKNPLTRQRANFARMAKRGWKPLNKN